MLDVFGALASHVLALVQKATIWSCLACGHVLQSHLVDAQLRIGSSASQDGTGAIRLSTPTLRPGMLYLCRLHGLKDAIQWLSC